MSEPKCIVPLLENFIMGDAISEHNGVRCCPAMEKDTEGKYIVKILSVPASQVQLDALLLTGVCPDAEAARDYFKAQADETVREAELLQSLASLEGFVGFEGWQIEPMEDAVGFDVYLLSTYRPTLERYLARNPMTHLGAVNLGLDLCAALSVCRQSGYLYVALKPGNIYHTEMGDYRIGDLGFVPLDSLKYASLPDKYRSEYTAPEIADAFSALNGTIDIYAVGLVLYQAYNNGQLPVTDESGAFPPPEYADYEIAEIILKACAANPEDRWQTPAELGQALVGYMQRNSITDDPIVPLPAAEEVIEETPAEEDPTTSVEDLVDEEDSEEVIQEDEIDPEQISFSLADETLPDEETAEALEEAEVSEEVSEMLAQADDLIAHETPDPVIPPDPIDVPIPEPIVEETEEPEEAEEPLPEEAEETSEEEPANDDIKAEEPEQPDQPQEEKEEIEIIEKAPAVKQPKKYKGILIGLTVILILLVLAIVGVLFYEHYYLQSVENIKLDGNEDYLTVMLDTDVDNSLLTVVCSDSHGNSIRQQVTNNSARFTGLAGDTQYKVTVEISGFHKLIGTTTDSYATESRTEIVNFTAITGAEDGSVILNFSVKGNDETAWHVIYSADGEDENTKPVTGHMLTITGLTVGKTYTYRLVPEADIFVTGEDIITHTASKLIYAENLTVHGFDNGKLNATWSAPAGVTVESWTVRCYNDTGYDTTFTVAEPSIAIADLDQNAGYTLDVNAAGMSLGQRAFVSAGSVTVKDVKFDDSVEGQLTVTWDYEGNATEDGWLLLYSINGGEQQVVHSKNGTSAVIPALVPGGIYTVAVQPPQGATVFGGEGTYTAPGGGTFEGYGTKAANISFRMCWTPKEVGWHWYYLWSTDFTTEYKVGEKASFVTHVEGNYTWSNDVIDVLFVIKNASGNPISITRSTRPWSGMFTESYGELDMPTMPETPGAYTVDIYFNNALAGSQAFTVKG